jgi:hypothetical protein
MKRKPDPDTQCLRCRLEPGTEVTDFREGLLLAMCPACAEVAWRIFEEENVPMNDAPLVRLCGVYENVSKSGDQYFTAYLGGAKLLLLKNKKAGEGEPPWTLLVTQRPEKAAQPAGEPKPAPRLQASRPKIDPTLDDDVPWLG